jgi:DNA-directed RNA polymerase specialized sigma24 family protein
MGTETYSADWLDKKDDGIDLRRRRADALNERIVQRAEWLEPAERALVSAMFVDGYSAAQIARLGNADPRSVRSRIHKIVQRLGDPRAAYVMLNSEQWTTTRRRVAREIYINGKSLRETADTLGLSFYVVRRHREAVEAMFDADRNTRQKIDKARIESRSWR